MRARSGAEALRHLLDTDFALILLDVHMPGLGGFETARYVTARERTRHIPIIFLTAAAADVEEIFCGYAAGAVDYVTKPFEAAVLRSKVAVFVALHRARAQRMSAIAAQAKAEADTEMIGKLQRLSDAALAHLDLEDLLAEVLARVRELFDADTTGIALTQPDGCPLRLAAADGLEQIDGSGKLADGSFVAVAAGRADPIVYSRRGDGPPLHATLELAAIETAAAIALRRGDELFGVLYLGFRAPGAVAAEKLALLELCAERAAAAIAHARTYEQEHHLVELLQRSLLPQRLPSVPRLELAARYLPSVETSAVGGDWYDVLRLPDGSVALVIGDVVGHGVQAATVMGELRHSLRAYVLDGHGPAAALARLDALVRSTHGASMIATVLVLLIEADSGPTQTLRFASAGHLPPLRVDADGAAAFLDGGLVAPLGVIDSALIEEAVAQIAPSETILLYTDGLIERRDESLDDGLARLRTCAAGQTDATLEAISDQILARVAVASERQRDDIALVAVRLRACPPERLLLRLAAEPSALREMRRELTAWLRGVGADERLVEDLRLACSEAAANAVEHAYGPGDHVFELEAERRDGAIHAEVRDFGGWRETRGQLRGVGLKLIRALSDTASIHRDEQGTRVALSMQLDGRRKP